MGSTSRQRETCNSKYGTDLSASSTLTDFIRKTRTLFVLPIFSLVKMKDLLESLYKRVMKTRNARFEAARRMERCDRFSVSCIAFLSLEIIAINIFQFAESSDIDKYISAATIFLSVFALVLSLIVNQAQYSLKASRYTACALSLDELSYEINRLLQSGKSLQVEDVAFYESKYTSIRKESNLNHDQCDHQWAMRKSAEVKEYYKYDSNPISYLIYRSTLWINHWIFSTYFIYFAVAAVGGVLVCLFISAVLIK